MPLRAGPLTGRCLEQWVAQASDVEIATAGGFAVLVPDGLRPIISEQCVDILAPQTVTEAVGEGNADCPVVTGLARRWHGGAYAADAAFGVGDGTVLLAPGRGWQDQVGIGGGFGVAIGILQHDELRPFQGGVDQAEVGH
ncbi:hypothetical protein SDC9_151162 [bioreactor metagenome]|uniref:Uncharacterized protein n=1 Tax=bioreactor metagenome TaxID=1076179 RepID=A0A645EQ22_9ZZZZ